MGTSAPGSVTSSQNCCLPGSLKRKWKSPLPRSGNPPSTSDSSGAAPPEDGFTSKAFGCRGSSPSSP